MQSMPKIFIPTDLTRKVRENKFNDFLIEMDDIIKRFKDVGGG